MHPRTETFVAQVADRYGFDVDVHEFEEGTKTAADAASVIGCEVAQIASSLVFVADDTPVVVIASGANRVDENRVAGVLGAEAVSMADPERVRSATGYGIGGVPPFAHDQDLTVLLDETLLAHEEVWAAAGTPQAVFPIAPDQLVELADAIPASVCE